MTLYGKNATDVKPEANGGWNLVGITQQIPIDKLPKRVIIVWEWSPSGCFKPVETDLLPGRAYWLYAE